MTDKLPKVGPKTDVTEGDVGNKKDSPVREKDPAPTALRLRTPDSPGPRKDRDVSFSPPSQQLLPEQGSSKGKLSFLVGAFRSLLALDRSWSKRVGVCAGGDSVLGPARPLMKLLEISGHGVPWIGCTLIFLCSSSNLAEHEMMLSLFFALILDLVFVGVVKALVRRRRPMYNKMDMFATVSVDKYSFPSGHTTRAVMVTRFLLKHFMLPVPLQILIVLWASILAISRVMLGRHYITDVIFGFFMGYLQYSLVEYLWKTHSVFHRNSFF